MTKENRKTGIHNTRKEDPEKWMQLENILGEMPPCFQSMQIEIVDFTLGKDITIVMPVRDEYLNPARTMQGGIICAAFDNAFGPLCLMASGTRMSVMVDMSTSFHRPLPAGDELTICAHVKSKGRRKVHMLADAFDSNRKLIASAVATYMILGQPSL